MFKVEGKRVDQATAEKAAIQAFQEQPLVAGAVAVIPVEHESGLVEEWLVQQRDGDIFARLIL